MKRMLFWMGLMAGAGLLGAAVNPALVDVKVYPTNANLVTSRDAQSIVVQAFYADGTTCDVTGAARYEISQTNLVAFQDHVLHPRADGQAELRIGFEDRTLTVPVKVEQAAAERPISFNLDVMPVLLKAGCNSGGCHGAARGKDGFRLSLFGFDPTDDYHRLTRENLGRRLNLALPNESLLLEKAAGRVTHTGGKLFEEASPSYQTLLRWIVEGAANDGQNVLKLVGLEVHPRQSV
ncbi:MAG TPA: cell surface protein, partial [Verrucomicrobiae bacterium]|nr:cell surface protein [Verrucomicrobiae bacterium]